MRRLAFVRERALQDEVSYLNAAKQEGKIEESLMLLTRLLRRKFKQQPPLESLLATLPQLPLASLEALADALLDFETVDDFQQWLARLV